MSFFVVKMRRVIYEEYEVEVLSHEAPTVVQAMDHAEKQMQDYDRRFVVTTEGKWAPISVKEVDP